MMRAALSLLAPLRRWWQRRRLDTLLVRYEVLRWALERVDEPEDVDLLTGHFKRTCDALGHRGWWRALDAYMAEPRATVGDENCPCPADPKSARQRAFAAAGLLALALFLALPVGANLIGGL